MSKNKVLPPVSSELRSLAEKRLRSEYTASGSPLPYEESQRLIYELQVHQIELEMQNEELRLARDERDKMEDLLGKYSDLYDFAPVGYFNLDHGGIIRAVNFTGTGFLGVERSLLIGRRLDRFISAETRQVFHDFLGKVFACETKETCDVEFLKKSHSPLFVQIEAVVSESGEECRAVVIDITERKQAKETLKGLNEELENRIAERIAEIREKDQMLLSQSGMAAMGEMIGNIAHQWRQPLNALGLTVQQLRVYYDLGELNRDCLDKSVLQSMELIRHMSRTIDDFRNYFRPDKEKAEFNLSESIADTLSLVNASFKDQHIDIEVVAKKDSAMFGYRNEFAQVILNILNNAREALTERKIVDPRVTITIDTEGERAVVIIADNAGGIPEEIMGKIFDPYFTTKDLQRGTGVGLFMSKSIIEKNMGGRLTARNTGDGAEFRIEV